MCISFITANAQTKIIYFPRIKDQFAPILNNKQLLIVGELHGTQEAPGFVQLLAKQLRKSGRKIKVGLEIETTNQPSIDSFMVTGDRSILKRMRFFSSNASDGRRSEAMAKLIMDMRKRGVSVFCFDDWKNNRDSMMAIHIQEQLNNDHLTIVLVGDFHAKIISRSESGIKNSKSMAYFMRENKNIKSISLKTVFASGTAWIDIGDGGKVNKLGVKPEWIKKWGKKSHIQITKDWPGYDGAIYFKKATASKPYID
jgi:hypothetical protein